MARPSFPLLPMKKANDNDIDAFSWACRELSRRDMTEFEIRLRLAKRNCSPQAIEETVKLLTEKGLIDDEKICRRLIEQGLAKARHGLVYFRAMAFSRGLSAAIIAAVEAEMAEAELTAARMAIEKKGVSGQTREKMGRFLAARGFSLRAIRQVLTNANLTDG